MAKLVKASGEITDVSPADGKVFSLEEKQTLVGGYIEVLPTNDPNFICIMDEEGKLKQKPVNKAATSMLSKVGLNPRDLVVGDVLVGTRKELLR